MVESDRPYGIMRLTWVGPLRDRQLARFIDPAGKPITFEGVTI
jgi:hypothetical protein